MFLTNDLRGDGFGAQYQSIIWSILFAEVKGNTFYYSDIESMNNGFDIDKKFIEDAVNCMNIKGNYLSIHDVSRLYDQTVYALKWPYFYKEIERDMEFFHSTPSFKKIKYLFYQNKKTPFDSEHTHVAVHIRKIVQYDRVFDNSRVVDTSYFIQSMEAIQANHTKEKPLLFHIYSVGPDEEFDEFKRFPIELHNKDDTFESFKGMVFADILVICASSMSYTAGLLSNGLVIYKPFWHPPRANWRILS